MKITTGLRRALLLLAPAAGLATVALIMVLGDLFFEWITPEMAMPFPLRFATLLFLLGIGGAATAYVILLLEPVQKIKVALISAIVWTGLLFYLILMNAQLPWNQGIDTKAWIALRSFALSLMASAGGLLVVYLYSRRMKKKVQKNMTA